MTEEETKKEKDSKEDDTENKDYRLRRPMRMASLLHGDQSFRKILAGERVEYQCRVDQLTPPPDFKS